jgi:hypothetical protein
VKRALLTAVLAIAVAACAELLPVEPVPAVSEASDDVFLLVVRSPESRFAAGEQIEVFAEVVYRGPNDRETIFHAASPVGWQILQRDGPAVMGGGMDMPCLTTDMVPGRPLRIPFQKGGAPEPAGPFTRAWFEEPGFSLPAGQWQIVAELSVALGDCGGEPHALSASIDLQVGP